MKIDCEGARRFCKCQRNGLRFLAPRWTSWIDENPRRSFFGCPNYKVSLEINNFSFFVITLSVYND